jgi:hypothetical protein
MRNQARLFTLNANGETIKVQDFRWVEQAMEAAAAAARELGEEIEEDEWCDTQIGYEAMTGKGREHMDETGEYPERYWQILGIDENGQDCEVESEHHEVNQEDYYEPAATEIK